MSFTNDIWLAIRSDVSDEGGDGTPGNPYAVNTAESFAKIMREKTSVNRIIRLGPGTFYTRGFGRRGGVDLPLSKRWSPLEGQRIIGAGMFSTFIKFIWDEVPLGDPGQHYYMMENPIEPINSFELSDLTMDCRLEGAPFDEDPVLASNSVTATLSGSNVTASSAFFTSDMATKKKLIQFRNPNNSAFRYDAQIIGYVSATQVTIDSSGSIPTGLPFWVYGPKAAVSAVAVFGDNIRLRRVRVINFGTRTPIVHEGSDQSTLTPARTGEGFPVRINGLLGDEAGFNGILEDCIFEQPHPSPAREVTCAVLSGGIQGLAAHRMHRQPFGATARNNYFNFDYVNPRAGNPVQVVLPISYSGSSPNVDATVTTRFPADVAVDDYVEIYGSDVAGLNGRFKVTAIGTPAPTHKLVLSFTFRIGTQPGSSPTTQLFAFKSPAPTLPVTLSGSTSSTTVGVTTSRKHHRKVGDWICISGAGVDDYNGTFKASSVLNDLSFEYQLITTPSAAVTGGSAWLDRRPSGYVRIKKVEVTDTTNKIAKVTTGDQYSNTVGPHYRKPGDWVVINNVYTSSDSYVNAYNSYLKIIDVDPNVVSYDPRTSFFVQLYSLLNTTQVPSSLQWDPNFAGSYQAISINGGIGGGMFGNRITNGVRGGSYHDFWWEDQHIARNNYYYNLRQGPSIGFVSGSYYRVEWGVSSSFIDSDVTVIDGTTVRVQLKNSSVDPGYRIGMAMRIIQGAAEVDGEISSIATASDFNVSLISTGQLAPGPGDAQAHLWFGQQLYFFEDNILDIAMSPLGDLSFRATGVYFRGPYWEPPGKPTGFNNGENFPWTLQLGIVRDNYIRKVNGATDPANNGTYAIAFEGCRNFIAEGNIFPVMHPGNTTTEQALAFHYSDVGKVKALNNRTPGGKLWQLMNWDHYLNNNEYLLEEIGSQTDDVMLEL